MKTNEYVKFVTESIVRHLDNQQQREMNKARISTKTKTLSREQLLINLFGIIPLALFFHRNKRDKRA